LNLLELHRGELIAAVQLGRHQNVVGVDAHFSFGIAVVWSAEVVTHLMVRRSARDCVVLNVL